ncbi:39S ribosomal protein L46, mitochondrial [Armadillidium nasatum]|uniref:Large ribosomal subunit protein mL46 n=1 Tax=Armadillidium nasatum TaxID=96803 RepID=A0A5N5TEA3_9CRUS|nr:39S ribosomal protein L46, mitochondrial [Armadillidium nasatum]
MLQICSKFRHCLIPHLQKSCLNNLKQIGTASAVANSTNAEPEWQLIAATCISRSPIITAELTPMEKEYKELVEQREFEQSLQSDHELRLIEDKIKIDLMSMQDRDLVEIEEVSSQTGTEFEDASVAELESHQFGSRVTDADKLNDMTSLNRALDRSLYLTISQKLGSQHQWVFPQTKWIPGETLRQSCERIVKDICGSKIKVKILGNSPCGFYKYKYSKEMRKDEGFIGAKVFFFTGHVLAFDTQGKLDINKDIFSDYLWLTQDELSTKLGKSYYQAVSSFIISDQ